MTFQPRKLGWNSNFWNGLGLTFIKRSFHATRPLSAPQEARYIKESFMYYLYHHSNKSYFMGHMVYGDVLPNGDFNAFGMLTTKPTTTNPNIKPEFISSSRIDGEAGEQYLSVLSHLLL